MTKKQRALEIIERLKKEYPDAGCTSGLRSGMKLLVSVRLAAQCTDARVNIVVEKLYEKFPDVDAPGRCPGGRDRGNQNPALRSQQGERYHACMKILRINIRGKSR